MHEHGGRQDQSSRFKLPIPTAESSDPQASLRNLFFESIEESLDLAAYPYNLEEEAYHAQLEYAAALSVMDSSGRAAVQFDYALASVRDDTALGEVPGYAQPSEYLRDKAVALAAAAAKLYGADPNLADEVGQEAAALLEDALAAENSPDDPMADMYRSYREPRSMLMVAGYLAAGNRAESEAWRQRVDHSKDNFERHLAVLDCQKAALALDDQEGKAVITGLQKEIVDDIFMAIETALRTDDYRWMVAPRDILNAQDVAQEVGIEPDVTSVLSAFEDTIGEDKWEPHFDETSREPSRYTRRPARDYEIQKEYEALAEAYWKAGYHGDARVVMRKALPYIEKKVSKNEDSAMEELAIAYLMISGDVAAETYMQQIPLRFRLDVRNYQIELAFDQNNVTMANAVLSTAVHELKLRLGETEPVADECEAIMAAKFLEASVKLGKFEIAEEIFELLKQDEDSMYCELQSKMPKIAKHFAMNGNIARAFEAISYATPSDQASFLSSLMKIMCKEDVRPIEAIVIDEKQLADSLQALIKSQKEARDDGMI